jgi:hypothetical protein
MKQRPAAGPAGSKNGASQITNISEIPQKGSAISARVLAKIAFLFYNHSYD